jgi:hypothetical protein
MIAALVTLALMVGGGILGGGMWAGSISTTLHVHGDAIQGIQRDVKDGYKENAEQHVQINQKIDTMGGKLDRIISSQWQTNHSAQSSATPQDAEGFASAHGAQPQ